MLPTRPRPRASAFLLFHSLPQTSLHRTGWLLGFVKGRECCAMEQLEGSECCQLLLLPSVAVLCPPQLPVLRSSTLQQHQCWGEGKSCSSRLRVLRRQQPGAWNNCSCCIRSSGGSSGWALPSSDFYFGHPVVVGCIPDTRHLAKVACTDSVKYLCLCSKAQKCSCFEKE